MASRIPLHFGVLIGSARPHNNNHGVFQWVRQHLEQIAPGSKISVYEPFTPPLPLGPFTGDYMAMALDAQPADDGYAVFPYSTEKDKQWSRIVQDFDAVLVVTPQHNWLVPSTIKEAIDHLFNEWVKMPFMAVNYGGQGGNKCAAALHQVFDSLIANPVSVEKIMIKLPGTHTGGSERVTPSTEFLKEYEATLDSELRKLVEAAQVRQGTKRTDVFEAKAYVAAEKAKQRAAAAAKSS